MMMKKILLFMYATVSAMAANAQIELEQCVVDAFNYLNAIRQNPSAYSAKIGVDLNEVESRPTLKWDEALVKAAQAKAEDMATRNYFAHIDPDGNGMNVKINEYGYKLPERWYDKPANNFFESIGCGSIISTGESVINLLIIDAGTPSLGHRKHLLGVDEFWSNCYDIGIGHAYNPNSEYCNYWSILIAKHSM